MLLRRLLVSQEQVCVFELENYRAFWRVWEQRGAVISCTRFIIILSKKDNVKNRNEF